MPEQLGLPKEKKYNSAVSGHPWVNFKFKYLADFEFIFKKHFRVWNNDPGKDFWWKNRGKKSWKTISFTQCVQHGISNIKNRKKGKMSRRKKVTMQICVKTTHDRLELPPCLWSLLRFSRGTGSFGNILRRRHVPFLDLLTGGSTKGSDLVCREYIWMEPDCSKSFEGFPNMLGLRLYYLFKGTGTWL